MSAPTDDIDWALPPRPAGGFNVFDQLSGPGGSASEITITAVACALGVANAFASMQSGWGLQEQATSIFVAIINCSAAVQCNTPASKRWYHQGGRLRTTILLVSSNRFPLL